MTQVVVPPVRSSSERFSVSNRESSDRRYNIVVSGIAERPHGTSRVVHTCSDFDTISSQLTGLRASSLLFGIAVAWVNIVSLPPVLVPF